MRWLLYGGKGWIGGQLLSLLLERGEEVMIGVSRLDDYEQTRTELGSVRPDRVLCVIGRTNGQVNGVDYPNIDYLELPGKLVENLRDNLHAPLTLARICQEFKIHMTYLGTGCIYEYDDEHPVGRDRGFTEQDHPNFMGSQYSAVKGVTDQLIRGYGDYVLNARIRMPISEDIHPRNFITKITRYQKVASVPNSMSVLSELLPILLDLATHQQVGTINLVNPGVISHQEILDLYQKYVDPQFTYELMDLSELPQHVVAKRSNNYLETTKLELWTHVTPIYEAVTNALIRMGETKI